VESVELNFISKVPSDLSLLAFGIPPAREAESAGGMPKAPKGHGLRSTGSAFCGWSFGDLGMHLTQPTTTYCCQKLSLPPIYRN